MAPGYRPPSTEPRGRWARHIHAYRKAHGLNATRAFEMWHAGLGMAAKSRTAYLAIDKGDREPTEREAEYLASQIGWPPESPTTDLEATETPVAGLSALVAAIAEQTRVMGELVEELRLARGLTPEVRERVAALEAYADEHERRLQADRQQQGLSPQEAPPSLSRLSVGTP